jgi:hypothetical protein
MEGEEDSPVVCPCCGEPFSEGTVETVMLTKETGTFVHTWCVPLAEQGKFLSKPEINVSTVPVEARLMTRGEIRAAGLEVSEDPCANCGGEIRDDEPPLCVEGRIVCADCRPPSVPEAR